MIGRQTVAMDNGTCIAPRESGREKGMKRKEALECTIYHFYID